VLDSGSAPICGVLSEHGCPIAPRTYWAWASRAPSKRALWDTAITEVLAGYYEPDEHGHKKPESLYGSVKMWAHLNRQGIRVAKCTVERLMHANGWEGVRRVKKVRTTVPDPTAERAPDLVQRRFRAPAPCRLLVADFTYVRMATGCFAYTAFVIDAYANRIVGWECSTSKETAFGETLMLNGMTPSVGSVGDAFDNALAETTIGLYKHECTRADSPFRRGPLNRLSDLEMITADWVHWYNSSRLMHHLGRIPPIEAEANYYATTRDGRPAAHT